MRPLRDHGRRAAMRQRPTSTRRCRRMPCAGGREAPDSLAFDGRRLVAERGREGGQRHDDANAHSRDEGGATMTTTLWRGARLVTLADARGWGLRRARRAARRRRRHRLGRCRERTCRANARRHRGRPRRRARHAGTASTATPTSSTPASAPASSSMRLEGASYEDIAAAGGGIRSTVAAHARGERRDAVRPRPRAARSR